MDGTAEDPTAPRLGNEPDAVVVEDKPVDTRYPQREVERPITLHKGMSEVSLELRTRFSPFLSNGTLRARYGITKQVQLGFRYNFGGLYNDPGSNEFVYNLGKAAGLDLTYQIKDFIGVSLGVPVYFDPVATSIQIGVPLRFRLGDNMVFGGLNDLIEIRVTKFMPSYTWEYENELLSKDVSVNTTTNKSNLRLSGYATYQKDPKLAFTGRLGVTAVEFSSTNLLYSLRGALQFTPKRYLDLGAGLGFDDLARASHTFGLDVYLSVRI